MTTVFVADAHLLGLSDPNQASLVRFVDSLQKVETFVVLGDLFDYWVGYNSVVYKEYAPVLESFSRLMKRGTKFVYIEGNHDFLMGEHFTKTLGADVYDESVILDTEGMHIFLAHGDTVKMTVGYGRWRKFARGPYARLLTLVLGSRGAWWLARRISRNSRQKSMEKYKVGSDLDNRLREAARFKIDETGVDAVVMGHSHSPGVHDVIARGLRAVYANPGAWVDNGRYMEYSYGEFRLKEFGSEEGSA
jgi:UDP-2,3-diacylglucosamine hydrolase